MSIPFVTLSIVGLQNNKRNDKQLKAQYDVHYFFKFWYCLHRIVHIQRNQCYIRLLGAVVCMRHHHTITMLTDLTQLDHIPPSDLHLPFLFFTKLIFLAFMSPSESCPLCINFDVINTPKCINLPDTVFLCRAEVNRQLQV